MPRKNKHTEHFEDIHIIPPRPERRFDARFSGFLIGILVMLLVVTNAHVVAGFLGSLNPFRQLQSRIAQLEKENTELKSSYQTTRHDLDLIEDASNILLALQEYYFTRGVFPITLSQLDQAGLVQFGKLRTNVYDVHFWYYRNKGSEFVLCVYASDGVRGVQTAECPQGGKR